MADGLRLVCLAQEPPADGGEWQRRSSEQEMWGSVYRLEWWEREPLEDEQKALIEIEERDSGKEEEHTLVQP